ncbi:MAG: MBL fold metallo-hydrolase [Desulfurococcales archaeon]|nr:MBL fold metallo-hydrolase [Desulfurococcales archaeon]
MASWVRLHVILDNEPAPGLARGWGWSVYLEAPGWRGLFDADTEPSKVEHNAEALGVDLSRLDWALLSHHHYDHKGGFPAVARARPGLPVYVPPGCDGTLERLGLKPRVARAPTPVAEAGGEAWSSGPLRAPGWGLWEHALALRVGSGVLVVVGCSHPGADRLAEAALRAAGGGRLLAVIGGFHGPPPEVLDRLAGMAEAVCPTHCSGPEALAYLERRHPDRLCRARTGSTLKVTPWGVEVESY